MSQKHKAPRRKRLNRSIRLISGTRWLKDYKGKNVINVYANHFGVDKLCAIKDLEMLGVSIAEERKKQVADAHNRLLEERRKKKEEKEKTGTDFIDSDEEFAFIAGYTPGGAPYGIRWDEQERFIGCDDEERHTTVVN